MPETRYRFWGTMLPPKQRTPILDATPLVAGTATMRIYSPIDSWGGEWGVSAVEFVDALAQLPANTSSIDLRLNSPGGEVFEAIAILNALRDHPATVTATVDGIAASAASFIACSADETVMGKNAQMMIHDASGIAIGNAADMQQMCGILNKLSDNIASIYADKAGSGGVSGWRATMQAESWYSADEAVAAGLADRVAGQVEPTDVFDLSIFNFKGRKDSPGPVPPVPQPSGARFTEQLAAVVADASAVIDRASEVVALRAEKGKSIAADSAELLGRLGDQLSRIADLVKTEDTPSGIDEEYMRFLAKRYQGASHG